MSKKKDGKPLTIDLLKDYYKEISSFSLEDRINIYKLRSDRADVIVPALQIYINVMRWAEAEEIYVPKIGLADGLIQHLYDELKAKTPFCVIEKDGLRINLFENKDLAKEHSPEFRLVTTNIEEVYKRIASSHSQFLHPNLSKITLRSWGAKEFALMDKQVGIIIQEW